MSDSRTGKTVSVGASIPCSVFDETAAAAEKAKHAAVLAKAERGGPNAWYELGMSLGPKPEAARWLCRAADQRHAKARHQIAWMYEYGYNPFPEDHVKSHLWYSLAITAGSRKAASSRNRVAKKMTQAKIAKARRRVKKWRPGKCGVEVRKAKVGG